MNLGICPLCSAQVVYQGLTKVECDNIYCANGPEPYPDIGNEQAPVELPVMSEAEIDALFDAIRSGKI